MTDWPVDVFKEAAEALQQDRLASSVTLPAAKSFRNGAFWTDFEVAAWMEEKGFIGVRAWKTAGGR